MADISKCFKDYDIRGKAPAQLNAAFAEALGAAAAQMLNAKNVVIGRDARLSGPELVAGLTRGLQAGGAQVTNLDVCGTEELYYAARQEFDAGVMVTGSHNPADENGFKLVRAGAVPIGADSGLKEIARATLALLTAGQREAPAGKEGGYREARGVSKTTSCGQTTAADVCQRNFRSQYVDWLMGHAQASARPLKIVADAGNGCAGIVLTELARRLPHELVPVNFEPDGHFPNGVPNPLLPERREAAAQAVREHGADFGVAFDGDFDRCFFFDHTGKMVESCYLIGLLAANMLAKQPGQKIVHDARVYWLTRELVEAAGGTPVMSKGGHTRMKETMRRENALYGAEMSAHHFYRDFAYCDSGMLTFILLTNVLAEDDASLADLVCDGMERFPCSGEINFRVQNAAAAIQRVWDEYAGGALHTDRLDGLNVEFGEWRFNLRCSNTEPLLRLNVESRGNAELLAEKTAELRRLIF